jgi:DNA-binding LytR/AlgR family response regulator
VKNYGQIKVSVSLQEVEKKLKGDDFIRPHHLYLVNLNYIKSITKNHTLEIYLEGGNTIPVSSQMEKKFREEIEKTLNVKII